MELVTTVPGRWVVVYQDEHGDQWRIDVAAWSWDGTSLEPLVFHLGEAGAGIARAEIEVTRASEEVIYYHQYVERVD